jgi:CubicO group peptidase (beta-lactamase class C family)
MSVFLGEPELVTNRFSEAIEASTLSQQLSLTTGALIAITHKGNSELLSLGTGITPDKPMEMGSVTKVFTGLLVADAVLRGELTLSTRVDELLFGENWGGVAMTVEHLATHTSGLPRLSMSKVEVLLHPLDPYPSYDRKHLEGWLRKKKPTVPADAQVSYSNFGYAVLGLMLERATRQTYEQLLQKRLLGPLGMSTSGLQMAGRADLAAKGHRKSGLSTPVWHFDAYAPCGAMV